MLKCCQRKLQKRFCSKEQAGHEVPIIHFYTMGRTDNIRKIARNVF